MRHTQMNRYFLVALISLFFLGNGSFGLADCQAATSYEKEYSFWKSVGQAAAVQGLKKVNISKHNYNGYIVLTNAGYAVVDGRETQGALDGFRNIINVSRGDFSLVEIHSKPETALWFAICQKDTGICVYLEVDESYVAGKTQIWFKSKPSIFSTISKAVITAEDLFADPDTAIEVFGGGVFNGNEFRIVTIVNAILLYAPAYLLRSVELHDHFCPGIMSGVFLAQYLKLFYSLEDGGSYFIQTVQPWCKEDALPAILNTTPGKKSYHVSYPTKEDMATWKDGFENAANIVYKQNPETGLWDGIVVSISLTGGDCPDYGFSLLDKMCKDLYFLDQLDHPEHFVTVLDEFTLEEGLTPKDYARPGVDPMKALGYTVDN